MIELFVKSLKFRFMNIGFFIIRILIVITAVSAVFMPAFFITNLITLLTGIILCIPSLAVLRKHNEYRPIYHEKNIILLNFMLQALLMFTTYRLFFHYDMGDYKKYHMLVVLVLNIPLYILVFINWLRCFRMSAILQSISQTSHYTSYNIINMPTIILGLGEFFILFVFNFRWLDYLNGL